MPNASRSWNRDSTPAINRNGRDEDRTNESVALKERSVDSGKIQFSCAPMLIEKRGCDQGHRRVISRSQFRNETERDQRQEHEEVEPLRQPQTLRDPESNNQRVQSFPTIEIDILRCVN